MTVVTRPYISPEAIALRAEREAAARARQAEAERLARELARLDAQIILEQQLANIRMEWKLRQIGIHTRLGVLRPPPVKRARKPTPRTLIRNSDEILGVR